MLCIYKYFRIINFLNASCKLSEFLKRHMPSSLESSLSSKFLFSLVLIRVTYSIAVSDRFIAETGTQSERLQ